LFIKKKYIYIYILNNNKHISVGKWIGANK